MKVVCRDCGTHEHYWTKAKAKDAGWRFWKDVNILGTVTRFRVCKSCIRDEEERDRERLISPYKQRIANRDARINGLLDWKADILEKYDIPDWDQ